MKIQIRRGVFETNSSSTHSLQVTSGSLENAYDFVNARIIEKYGANMKESTGYDPSDYITKLDDGTCILHLKGIDFGDGDESGCIYAIVKSWMAKVQYIAMLFRSFKEDLPEYVNYWDTNGDEFKKLHEKYSEDNGYAWDAFYKSDEYEELMKTHPTIQDTAAYKIFLEVINDTCKDHGFNIIKTSFDISDSWDNNLPGIERDETKLFFEKDVLADNEMFRNNLYALLGDNNTTMYFIDEAYSPYEGPTVKVY